MTKRTPVKIKFDSEHHRRVMAQILSSIRKSFAFTQMEFAELLNISQSKVSKLESASLDITASQWILLTKKLNIPFFYMDIACIDLMFNIDKPSLPAYKLTKELGKVRNVSARYLRPTVIPRFNYEQPKDYVFGVEQDFFVNLSNKLNSRFLLKPEAINFNDFFWSEGFSSDLVHGNLHSDFSACTHPREKLELFVQKSKHYFEHYDVEMEIKGNKINIAYTPQKDTLALAQNPDKKHEDALCLYNRRFLEGIANYGGSRELISTHHHCTHKGESFCLFEFNT